MNNNYIIVTEHAYRRAKERFNWKPKVTYKMAIRAYYNGVTYNEINNYVRKYIDNKTLNRISNNIILYGEILFLFRDNSLLTLHHVPAFVKTKI